jgi:dCTP deaminase
VKKGELNILTREDFQSYMAPSRSINDRLFISPLLEEEQLGDTSIDLRLGHWFLVSAPSRLGVLDLVSLHHEGSGILRDNYAKIRVPYGQYFTLHPGSSVQVGTLEYLGIPLDLQGIVTLRASLSAIPIIANAAQVHPGHRGVVTLTITSNAEYSIWLYPGVRTAELRLQHVHTPIAYPTPSRYHNMTSPVPTKLHEDTDLEYVGPTVEPIIVGIASTIAAGRSTTVDHLTEIHGFRGFSLAHVLKSKAISSGVPTLRGSLQAFGTQRRQLHGDAYLASELRSEREWIANTSAMVVVDGFKHVAEVEEFKKQRWFRLLVIDAPEKLRWQRVEARRRLGDPKTREAFLEEDRTDRGLDAQPHGQQVEKLLQLADEVIINDGTMQEFLEKVDRFVMSVLHAPTVTGE